MKFRSRPSVNRRPMNKRFFEPLFVLERSPIEANILAGADAIDIVGRRTDSPPALAAKRRMGAAPEAKPLAFLPVL